MMIIKKRIYEKCPNCKSKEMNVHRASGFLIIECPKCGRRFTIRCNSISKQYREEWNKK